MSTEKKEDSAAWNAFLWIVGMAVGAVTAAWSVWYVVDSATAMLVLSGALLVAYIGGSSVFIAQGGFRRGVVGQLVGLCILALVGTWLLGAIVALMVWGGPIGPAN